MSEQRIGLRLRGVERRGTAADVSSTQLVWEMFRGKQERAMVQAGCARLGVRTKADLLTQDGIRVRRELELGGEWTGAESVWVAAVRDKMGWRDSNQVTPPVPMPEPEVMAGDVLAIRVREEGGDVEIGCVETVASGEVRAVLLQRRTGRSRSADVFQLDAQGETTVSARLDECEWRKLDAGGADGARQWRMWMRGARRSCVDVRVTSSSAHTELRTHVAGVRGRGRCRVPDEDTQRMRRELEGVAVGAGGFEQRLGRYAALAAVARERGLVLYGFSDGALTADGVVGAYGWLVAVSDGQGGLEVLAAGGGSAIADDCTNIPLSSTRLEALGLAAGLSFGRDWTGRVEWRLDNKGVIRSWRRLRPSGVWWPRCRWYWKL
jgi:hypothetical protein